MRLGSRCHGAEGMLAVLTASQYNAILEALVGMGTVNPKP